MSILISAILSELASRSISFLIDKSLRPSTALTVGDTPNRLQRLLLRAQVVDEEAEGRLVTNQAMLQLLNRLRLEMYRGHHKLDTYRCRVHEDQATDQHQAVSPSFTQSSINPAKRFRLFSGSSSSSSEQERINEALASLEIAIRDASELVAFLSGCPRLYKQPYNMYLLLDNCMFGRQMEMERIMNFMLQEEAPDAEYPSVLPIVGPGKVGKTTMIEYACNDRRVRNCFSQIVSFSQDSIKDEKRIAALSDCDVIKHRNCTAEEERMLVIIELIGEIDEGAWRKLYSDCKHHLASGSKIIVASRSETIARFGTAQALRLQFLVQEAYWYFFKVRTFGSTNIEDHPQLASIAMEMAREMNGCFINGHLYSRLLSADFNTHFWKMALATFKEYKRMNLLMYGSRFVDPWQVVDPLYVRRVNKTSSEYIVVLDKYQTGSAQNPSQSKAPEMSVQELLFRRVRAREKFEVLLWRSHIPPHYSCILTCEVQRPQQDKVFRKKKRVQVTS